MKVVGLEAGVVQLAPLQPPAQQAVRTHLLQLISSTHLCSNLHPKETTVPTFSFRSRS
jgi:hypothetical protein